MIVNLDALKKRYSVASPVDCHGCQAKQRLVQQLLSELTSLQSERDEAVLLLQEMLEADDWELKPTIDAESFLARIRAGVSATARRGGKS